MVGWKLTARTDFDLELRFLPAENNAACRYWGEPPLRPLAPKKIFFPLVGLILLVLVAQHNTAQSADNELWLDQRFSFRLSPKSFLLFRLSQRANENVSHLFETFAGLDIGFHVQPWLTLMPGFLYDRQDPFGQNSRFENRPQLGILLHTRRERWRPNLRALLEGRFLQDKPGFVRFLLRPGVEYALATYRERPLVFFLTNDFAFDSRTGRFSRNQFQVGISLPATEHLSLIPYYMLESNRLPTLWDHDNIGGLSLSWSF
ncbi:MAG: DUF2490 domain-containing protein [Acidobacteria bacterium]|nr:DUF2490 domain-containing protein [Acidobacteriota bacterium]